MKDYEVLIAELSEISKEVNERLRCGYLLVGGACVWVDSVETYDKYRDGMRSDKVLMCSQAVARLEAEK